MPDSRSFRDPIHGFIPLNRAEAELLSTASFRRLRHIRQLALTNLVYHGAEHSRFGHSLGVMHEATLFFDTVTRKRNSIGWSKDDLDRRRQLLRLAALCHDLGHTPFSHAGEEGDLLDGKHEDFSEAIIVANGGRAGEVRQVIDAHKSDLFEITPEDIAAVISGRALGVEPFLYEILSGDLDCDRTDYLQRDSLYCGVRYGRFDSERLVATLTWTEDPVGGNPVLAIEEDGIHAAEGLILARYFMFTQVYFHRVRRAYDYHLGEALRASIGKYPSMTALDEYLDWDDMRVYAKLREMVDSGAPGAGHARRILERNHYRVAYATNEHPSSAQLRRWEQLRALVIARFGEQVAFDYAEKAPHKFDKSLRAFPVFKGDGEKPTSIEEESGLIDKLEELKVCRILAPQELRDAVAKFCDEQNLNVR